MIQTQFINALLQRKDATMLTINNIDKDYFSDYQNEFEYIQNHLSTYGTLPDIETFVAKFPNFDVINVSEPADYLLDALFDDRNQRVLARTFNKIRDALNADDTQKALQIFTNSQDELNKAVHLDSVDIFKDISRYDTYVQRSNDFSKYYVRTGFTELDRLIGGWDRVEELGVIIAPTNTGKTWLLLKTAVAAAEQGLTVGLYSGEMTENKVAYRIDTLLSHISNSKITHGNLDIQNDYKRYLDNLSNAVKGTIKVLTPSKIGGPAGVRALRAFVEKDNLDMLCIDQHSLLSDDRGARDSVQRAANISMDLKNLQVLKKIPIISVAQQNRSSDDETTGDKTKVGASYRIVQDATIAINAEHKDNILTLSLTKSRDSANGKKLKYLLDFDTGRFDYIPEQTDALKGADSEALRQEFEEDVDTTGENVF